MKKLSPIAYRSLFFKHLWRFLRNVVSQTELNASHAIAVSGGRDSMTLLWVAKTLHSQGKIGPVRAIFVDHRTRPGQKEDGKLIEKFCQEENLPFVRLEIKRLNPKSGNFEARARTLRRAACLNNLGPNELLWAGHHLDDSYEWNFMQRHRSNNPKASLGIPVRNGRLIRPFSCVTRAQITRLARFEAIPYRDDPTNKDLRFDRNYLRHEIIPVIRKRYPKYLKFYSHMANFMSMMLKNNIIVRSGASEMFVYDQGAVLIGKHFSEIQIQELIHHYSNTDRGEIITPIERMLKAIDNGKKGPFHFSGAMEAYCTHNILMIYSQGMKNYDEAIARVLGSLTERQFQEIPSYYKRVELEHAWANLLQTSDAMLNMPGLVLVLEAESVCKTLNTSIYDPLFPQVSALCKEKGWRFITYDKCLETWKHKRGKLPEKLRLLPLSNLSNLFTSQQ